MLGAIAGDIIGSVYEPFPIKTKEFPLFHEKSRFTDDSVLTIATANAILSGNSYQQSFQTIGRMYPDAGYGGSFVGWLFSDDPKPYGSWGNGSAMRVSPVGLAFKDLQSVLKQAETQARVSHNHPEGIRGAQAVAVGVFLARNGYTKTKIKTEIERLFQYDLKRRVEQIRPYYQFDVSCRGSVPEAVISFIDANSWEDAVRNAVSLGGDSDTLACISGAIAESYYRHLPIKVLLKIKEILPADLWEKTESFYRKYGIEEIISQLDTL